MTTWMEDDFLYILVENNTLVTYPTFLHGEMSSAGESNIPYPPEHINTFIEAYDIVPDYIDPNYIYGRYDEVTGKWSGMLGHVKLRIWLHFI